MSWKEILTEGAGRDEFEGILTKPAEEVRAEGFTLVNHYEVVDSVTENYSFNSEVYGLEELPPIDRLNLFSRLGKEYEDESNLVVKYSQEGGDDNLYATFRPAGIIPGPSKGSHVDVRYELPSHGDPRMLSRNITDELEELGFEVRDVSLKGKREVGNSDRTQGTPY